MNEAVPENESGTLCRLVGPSKSMGACNLCNISNQCLTRYETPAVCSFPNVAIKHILLCDKCIEECMVPVGEQTPLTPEKYAQRYSNYYPELHQQNIKRFRNTKKSK